MRRHTIALTMTCGDFTLAILLLTEAGPVLITKVRGPHRAPGGGTRLPQATGTAMCS